MLSICLIFHQKIGLCVLINVMLIKKKSICIILQCRLGVLINVMLIKNMYLNVP